MLIWYGHFVCLDLNLVNFQKKIGRSITNVTRVTKSLLHGLHRRELLVLWHQEYTQMLCGRTYLYRKMPHRMIERVTISWWNNNVTVCYMWMDMDTNNWMNEETPIYTHIHFVCTSLAASYAGGGHLVRARRRCNPRSSGTLGHGDAERLVLPDSLCHRRPWLCRILLGHTRAARRAPPAGRALFLPASSISRTSSLPHQSTPPSKQASKCFSSRPITFMKNWKSNFLSKQKKKNILRHIQTVTKNCQAKGQISFPWVFLPPWK